MLVMAAVVNHMGDNYLNVLAAGAPQLSPPIRCRKGRAGAV